MTIFELSKLLPILNNLFINDGPFVFVALPSTWSTGAYWTTAFGAPAESVSGTINITSFVRDSVNVYSSVLSVADCRLIEQSFYWDNAAQTLYVHLEHEQGIASPSFKYGKTFGYCNKKACYIGGIFYAPIVKSVPNLAQKQDLVAYDKLSFLSGNVVLDNVGGDVDEILTESFFGYQCFIAHLDDDERDDYERTEIQYLAALYVEDFSASKSEVSLKVQDRRKASNIKIPNVLFTAAAYPNIADNEVGKPIPLAFGLIRSAPAVCTNGKTVSGAVSLRVALAITNVGTVQVKIGEVWTTVATASTDLPNGSFTLASGTGRDGSGNIYECRLLAFTGTAVVHASDIIKALNLQYLSVLYVESEYDLAEWTEAEAQLSTVGLFLNKQVELFEAIRQIQSGANVGFRYEYKSDGRRTIRIDDFERAAVARICVEDIEDIREIGFETDSALLAASVKINYAKDYSGDEFLSAVDASLLALVLETYRLAPQIEFDTLLTTAVAAAARALADLTKYSIIRNMLSVPVMGSEFLGLRIYDVVEIEATAGFVDADYGTVVADRPWLGCWRAQVLSVDPDLDGLKNKVGLILIEELPSSADIYVLADYDGRLLLAKADENYLMGVEA
jgi:hypothetical protein